MYSTIKFANLLLAVAASAQETVTARNKLAELSVILFNNVNLTGASYTPAGLVEGVCNTLPCRWLDRAESVLIGPDYTCTFFVFEGCEGNGTTLSGQINSFPDQSLYNNIESLSCNKEIS